MFDKRLPHINTIRRWLSSVDASPGITEMGLEALREKVRLAKKENKTVFVALISDDVSIKKEVHYNQRDKSFTGFVSKTNVPNQSDENGGNTKLPVAKDELVFMAVGPDFKIPVGHFPNNGLSAVDRAALTMEEIRRIDLTGAKTISLTGDAC